MHHTAAPWYIYTPLMLSQRKELTTSASLLPTVDPCMKSLTFSYITLFSQIFLFLLFCRLDVDDDDDDDDDDDYSAVETQW